MSQGHIMNKIFAESYRKFDVPKKYIILYNISQTCFDNNGY